MSKLPPTVKHAINPRIGDVLIQANDWNGIKNWAFPPVDHIINHQSIFTTCLFRIYPKGQNPLSIARREREATGK